MEERSDPGSIGGKTPESEEESRTRSNVVFRSHLSRYAFRSSDKAATTNTENAYTQKSPKSPKATPKRSLGHSASTSSKRARSKLNGSRKPPPLNIENKLVDSLRPGLTLVMIGVNPGLTTAQQGHAYSHKSNRYWPTMHASGVTPILHPPSDTALLQDLYNIGHTNIVSRPTVTENDLHHAEFMQGAEELDKKMRRFRPEACAVVGKGIWLRWVEWKTGKKGKELEKGFQYGWQDESLWIGRSFDIEGNLVWSGARTIVVATTSGAAAQFAANGGQKRIELWKPLGDWFTPKREEWVENKQKATQRQESS